MCHTLLAISLSNPPAIAAIAIALIIAAYFAFRPNKSVGEPSCGQCGYSVQGLESMNCPECGGDLRSVGIVTSHVRLAPGPLTRCLRWTLLLPIPAVLLSMWVSSMLPRSTTTNTTAVLTGSSSGVIASATVESTQTSGGNGMPTDGPAIVCVVLTDAYSDAHSKEAESIERDSIEIRVDQLKASASRHVEIRRLLEQWFADHDVSGDYGFTEQLIRLSQYIDRPSPQLQMYSAFSKVNMRSTIIRDQFSWYVPFVVAFWILVWLALLFLSVMRWRRERNANLRPRTRERMKAAVICIVWTAAIGASAWFSTRATYQAFPAADSPNTVTYLRASSRPTGVQTAKISVAYERGSPIIHVVIFLSARQGLELQVDFNAPEFAQLAPDDTAGREAVVTQLVEQRLIGPRLRRLDRGVKQAASDIAANVISLSGPDGHAIAGDRLKSAETTVTQIVTVARWVPAASLLFWAAIWLVGVVLIKQLFGCVNRRSDERDEPVSSVA